MLQVVQHQKTGEILIEEMPAPACPHEGILVQSAYTLISAGTEKISVSNTRSSLLQRARKQPDQVKIVLDNVKKEGIISTIKKVKSKLDSFKTLGYSASGIVIESACDEFAPGDRVACAGAGYASHAEILAIPKNLAARLPDSVSLEEAAYTTLGIIAMQGVRQSEAKLGETVAVIGLGLIGQITVKLLKAAGCRVAGLDINESLFETAIASRCDAVYPSSFESVESIKAFSRGMGCDSVIITAAADSNQPVELAIEIARKKGKIIIVGAVGMDLPRSPFYEKELDIRISCSYGPGRYDPLYEQGGVDYPAAYVRWTENRNMQAFLDLIADKKINVGSLTTHKFRINDAKKAYDLITGKSKDPYLGILLQYPERAGALSRTIEHPGAGARKDNIHIAFVGAGAFARSNLLPYLKDAGVELVGVSTETPVNAKTVARQFGFKLSSTDSSELIKNKDVNTVFCATRHYTHAKYVIEAIEAGKPVFVEKPLATNPDELERIDKAVHEYKGKVITGFNRRFSKTFGLIEEFFSSRKEPMAISYRVNAGYLPPNHWVFTPENGGRIIGEACHFIDCMVFLTKALPVRVSAVSLSSSDIETVNQDNVIISIKFEDGSVGTVQYFANGNYALPKEYCEIHCEKSTALMNNFKTVELYRGSKIKKHSLNGKKGHKEEVQSIIQAIRKGIPMPIPYRELRAVTLAAFAAVDSLSAGNTVELL